MYKDAPIYVTGHKGLVGSSLLQKLQEKGYHRLITRTHSELDLTDQRAVAKLFRKEQPEYVLATAAKVGGILANITFPADFMYQNLAIQTNIIHQSYLHKVRRLLFLGSSCIYPRNCPQPMKEEYLLSNSLEPTNEFYAIAKIAGVKMCQAYNKQYGTKFLCLMPTNLYGPNDNFDLETSHVLPALIRKFHEAKQNNSEIVRLWGTGRPRREFLYIDDLADACLHLLDLSEDLYESLLSNPRGPLINVGCGQDLPVRDLATLVARIVGYKGQIEWDAEKPDGTPRKLLDVHLMASLKWQSKVSLHEGISRTYKAFLSNDLHNHYSRF